MPRKSLRRRALDIMQEKIHKLRMMYYLRETLDEEDSFEDKRMINETAKLNTMMNNWYLLCSSSYQKNRNKFDLEDTLSYDSVNFNDEEFVYSFRISRDSFFCSWELWKT